MSTIKNKINQNIISPNLQNLSNYNLVAQVTSINEKTNTCSIKFKDKNGDISNINNVNVKIYNPNLISWFPSVNDIVNVEYINNSFVITSLCEVGYGAEIRYLNELKNDILSTQYIDTLPGFIL